MPSLMTWTRTSWPRLKTSWISGLGRPAPGRPPSRPPRPKPPPRHEGRPLAAPPRRRRELGLRFGLGLRPSGGGRGRGRRLRLREEEQVVVLAPGTAGRRGELRGGSGPGLALGGTALGG